jgi:hypothetical protein
VDESAFFAVIFDCKVDITPYSHNALLPAPFSPSMYPRKQQEGFREWSILVCCVKSAIAE